MAIVYRRWTQDLTENRLKYFTAKSTWMCLKLVAMEADPESSVHRQAHPREAVIAASRNANITCRAEHGKLENSNNNNAKTSDA